MESVREFFETLPGQIPPDKAAGISNSWLFDIAGAGIWRVAVDDGKVDVTEGESPADTRISMSEDTFRKLVDRELNPMKAFMTRKIKVDGNMAVATKLGKILG
jgi:putative sterol carrier protein